MTNLKTFWTTRQKSAIENGYKLTARLQRYTEEGLGLRPNQVSTKRHTIIWSPPGAGKTFTVRKTCEDNGIEPIKFHGHSSMNAFAITMAVKAYTTTGMQDVWIDDCDSFFYDDDSINLLAGVLDEERNILGWNVNMNNEIARAEKAGNDVIAQAIRHFSNDGVGLEVGTERFRFIITTNKRLASKREIHKSQRKMNEHKVRDRVQWRSFDITSDEAWGWMASTMLSSNVFEEDGFKLDDTQTHMLLDTFYKHWDDLSANSMRTVKEAGAMLYNNPDDFMDEFEQHFLD